ncbi:hypothetical protein OAF54_03715 [bacterium]|nr:hypothetical protein [bacterium]
MNWECTMVQSNNVDGTTDYCVVIESDWMRDKEMAEETLAKVKKLHCSDNGGE